MFRYDFLSYSDIEKDNEQAKEASDLFSLCDTVKKHR